MCVKEKSVEYPAKVEGKEGRNGGVMRRGGERTEEIHSFIHSTLLLLSTDQ